MIPHITRTPIILASGSAARRQMLEQAGYEVRLHPVAVDEAALRDAARDDGMHIDDVALLLAETKARRAAAVYADEDVYVLGADQMLGVSVDGVEHWLEKPAHHDQAIDQLMMLSGRTHFLWSAAMLFYRGQRIWHHVACAEIDMHPFDRDFCRDYLEKAGPDILHSVGCYHIEGLGVRLIHRLCGDFFVVRGLPLLPLAGFLR